MAALAFMPAHSLFFDKISDSLRAPTDRGGVELAKAEGSNGRERYYSSARRWTALTSTAKVLPKLSEWRLCQSACHPMQAEVPI
jgi:hypothetical protein